MKTLLFGMAMLVTALLVASCKDDAIETGKCNGVFATVIDKRGFDGCGYIFRLDDGTSLEPYRIGYCGTPPLPKEVTEDPLYNFEFADGKRVRIVYQEMPDYASACMMGKIVKITCLEEIEVSISEK